MKALSRQHTVATVRQTLAADFACPEVYFDLDGAFIGEAKEIPGRRRFPVPSKSLALMTMGAGVVITCNADRLSWVQSYLGSLDRDTLFSAATCALLQTFVAPDYQSIAGPHLKFVCASDTFRPSAPPDDVTLELITRTQIQNLYTHIGFRNALSYQFDNPRPDMVATVARHRQTVIGIAGASADNDDLWQIGVDVLAPYQGRGIGKALVSRLTTAILAEGKVPYYTTTVSNLRSSNLALGLGYWPAWIEVYARDK